MRTMFMRLSVVAALLSPLAMLGVSAGPVYAAGAGTVCTANSGSIKLSPGLEATAQVQRTQKNALPNKSWAAPKRG